MNAFDVLVDLIESLGIGPMPCGQLFGEFVEVGYQINGSMVSVRGSLGADLIWLMVDGSRVTIVPGGRNKSLVDCMVVDLACPGSFDSLCCYISA
jgi:hypothetical protein